MTKGRSFLRSERLRTAILILVLLACAGSARAGAFLTASAGGAFGGTTDGSKAVYGGSLTFAGDGGILGFAVDFAYAPDFFGRSGVGNNSMTTLMGNLVLITPGGARLYASAGAGLMKPRLEDASGLLEVHSNELGVNVGGGLLLIGGGHVGVQGDVRYFRSLTHPDTGAGLGFDLGSLDYWRAMGGVAIRF